MTYAHYKQQWCLRVLQYSEYVINKATCMVSTVLEYAYLVTRYLYCIPITDVRYIYAYCSIFDDLVVLVIIT